MVQKYKQHLLGRRIIFYRIKPIGHGTRLGLSLSYDIIKLHGGEIRDRMKNGEEAAFVNQLHSIKIDKCFIFML